jgi:hypothetical protein
MLPQARFKALLAAAAFCAAALAAAIPGHASTSITLARYDKRADAVCLAYHRKAVQLPQVGLSDFPGIVKLVHRTLPLVAADIAKLRAIPLPAVKRRLARLWLHRHYRIPTLLKALEVAAEEKSLSSVRVANQALQANGAADRSLARRLGMKTCSHP